jgi:hypothetical protein
MEPMQKLSFYACAIGQAEVAGQPVYFRELTELELQRWSADMEAPDGTQLPGKVRESRVSLIILAVCHKDGAPMFEAADAPAISQWPATVTRALHKAICKHNQLGEQTDADKRAAEKNSVGTPTADSC